MTIPAFFRFTDVTEFMIGITILYTVMIRFCAWGAYSTFGTTREGTYSGQGAYFFFEKQSNVQNKTLIFILKGTITETETVTNIR